MNVFSFLEEAVNFQEEIFKEEVINSKENRKERKDRGIIL